MGETLFGMLTNDEGVVRKRKRKERLKAICDSKQKAKEREEERVYRKWISSQKTDKLVTGNGIENLDRNAGSKDSHCTEITGCRDTDLRMIKGDVRIGKGYDFHSGGEFEDMSFERERTLLQLWEIYRNGYSTDQVLSVMYIPVHVTIGEKCGRVKCRAEKSAMENSIIEKLRNRYQEIKEEEMMEKDRVEMAEYNETLGIRPTSETLTSGLLGAMSPRPSRPVSMLSAGKDSPLVRSFDRDAPSNVENLIKLDKEKEFTLLQYCCYYCCPLIEE